MLDSSTLALLGSHIRHWPEALYIGNQPATLEQCQTLKSQINDWLKTDLPEDQREFLNALKTKVIIHQGQLNSDTLRCFLGECG